MPLPRMGFPPHPRKHWTPRYVLDRVSLAAWEATHPERPWLTQSAVAFLDDWVGKDDLVVEFGSGRSTRWFAEHVREVISIEHDSVWYERVKASLSERGTTNVRSFLAPETVDGYVGAAAAALGDVKADVILVDGQLRDACARWATGAIRPGGLLVLDNANWFLPSRSHAPASIAIHSAPANDAWSEVWRRCAAWRRAWMLNGITETLLLFAPPAPGAPA